MAEFLSIFHQGFHRLQAGYTSYYSVILSAVRNSIQMGSCQDRRKGRVLSFQSGVDISGLAPDGVTAFVMAYQEIEGGALTTTLTPSDVAAIVTEYLLAEKYQQFL